MASQDTGLHLAVLVVDPDLHTGRTLTESLRKAPGVQTVAMVPSPGDIHDGFDFNVLFIDPFHHDARGFETFVDQVRHRHPAVPICLYSSSAHFAHMPQVSTDWRNRFLHYYKLPKNAPDFEARLGEVLTQCVSYLMVSVARNKISTLRSGWNDVLVRLPQERQVEFAVTLTSIENALKTMVIGSEDTEKITLKWLWNRVPARLWLVGVALVGSTFAVGARVGPKVPVIRELVGISEAAEISPDRSKQIDAVTAAYVARTGMFREEIEQAERIVADPKVSSELRSAAVAQSDRLHKRLSEADESYQMVLRTLTGKEETTTKAK